MTTRCPSRDAAVLCSAVCPHRGGPLADGQIDHDLVVCLCTSTRCQARPISHVAAEMGRSRVCASKWVHCPRQFGELGLLDRPSVPHHEPPPPRPRCLRCSVSVSGRSCSSLRRPRARNARSASESGTPHSDRWRLEYPLRNPPPDSPSVCSLDVYGVGPPAPGTTPRNGPVTAGVTW